MSKSMNERMLGKHWLLLRGLGRESAHWGEFTEQLAAGFPESTVTTLDLPGTGSQRGGISPSTIPAIAEQVRAIARKQGLLRQPVTLLAISLGGMVAWEWLRRYPEDCCGAALVNTSFANVSPFYHRLSWRIYGRCFHMLRQRDVYRRELEIVGMVTNREERYPEIAEYWAALHKQRPISPRTTLRQLLAAAAYRPHRDKPVQPVLLLNALGDRLVSPACSEAIHKRWQVEMRRHPWGGHDLTLDDGDWVVEQLRDWLGG